MAGKKKYIALLAVVLIAAVIGALLLAIGNPKENSQVSREEYLLVYENEIRPRVLILSQNPGEDWQNEPYEGSTLGQYAAEQTVAALKSYKAQQQVFRQYKVYDFTYEEFLTQWQNQKDDGNPYGVQVYSQYDYYVYLHSIYALQVMQQLSIDEEAAKIYYENNTDEFRNADTWVLDVWQTSSQTPDARKMLEEAKNGENHSQVSYEQVTIDEDGAKYYSQLVMLLSEDMQQLKTPGQTVYRENNYGCFLVRSQSFAAGQPKTYDECKDVVQNRCKQEKFDQEVAQAFENITVEQQALPEAGK